MGEVLQLSPSWSFQEQLSIACQRQTGGEGVWFGCNFEFYPDASSVEREERRIREYGFYS